MTEGITPNEPKSKYKAKQVWLTESGSILKKTEIQAIGSLPNGAIPFASKLEAEYYRDVLLPLETDGLIQVVLQPRYEIFKGFERDGIKYKPVYYVPDFAMTDSEGKTEAIDVKGMTTPVFLLKRKLFLGSHPDHKLRVLKFVKKFGGWVTIEEYEALKKQERKRSRADGTKPNGSTENTLVAVLPQGKSKKRAAK